MNYWVSQSPPNQGQYHSQLQFPRQQLQQNQPPEGENTNLNYAQQQMPNEACAANESDRPFLSQTNFPQQQQQHQQQQYPLPMQPGYPYQYQYTSYQPPYKYYQPQQSFTSSSVPNTLFNGSTTSSSSIPHYILNRPSNDDAENFDKSSHLPYLQQMNTESSDQSQNKSINTNSPYSNTLPVIHHYKKSSTVNPLPAHKPVTYSYSQPPTSSRYGSIPNVAYTTQQTPQSQQGPSYQYYIPQQQPQPPQTQSQPQSQQTQQSGYQLYPISQSHSNLNATSQTSLTSHTPSSMVTSSSNEQPNMQFDQQKSQGYLPSIQSQQSLVTPLVAQQTPLRFLSTDATLNSDTQSNVTPAPITSNKPNEFKKPEMAITATSTDDDEENDKHHQQDPDQGFIHRCHLCDKSFKRKSWLKRHLLSHSPERHFSCPWCLSKHKRKDNLLQHMKLKHADSVLQELKLHHVDFNDDLETVVTSSNNNIKTLLYEGKLNKDEVKKVLNSLIDRHNQI